MYTIKGTIEGVAPILFSRPDPEKLEATTGGPKKTAEEKQAEIPLRLHKNANGVYVPKNMFKNCLLEGVTKANLKERGNISQRPYLEATVFPKDHLYFGKMEHDDVLETWGRIPPKTGAAVVLRYPMMNPGWKLDFALLVADDSRRPGDIKRALEAGGLLVGIGSWRPEYGRFMVTDWESER